MSSSLLKAVEHAGKYFNCWKYEMSGYLNGRGLPVDYLFYNALESSDQVFAQIIQLKKNRWVYETACLRDEAQLHLIGVSLVRKRFETFDQLAALVPEVTDQSSSILLLMDSFYVPHSEHYQTAHHPHSYVITSYQSDELLKETIYNLVDIVIDDYKDFPYAASDLKLMYESSLPTHRAIAYFDIKSDSRLQKERILDGYHRHLRQYSDNYVLHDQVIAGIDSFDGFTDQQERLYHLEMAYTFMAGSRYMYARFLKIMGFQAASESYYEAGEQAESLSNMYRRYGLIGEVDSEELVEECKRMKEMEQEALYAVRQQAMVSG
ncbi:hypothetical protein [Paenibacillus agilis]|uniref:Butirosin biosynthesis protein H N-terminal domain-containing protein n=1 Tax=Paenibacillus agilis TaxID=3020863 RepID=A0A559IWZ5_9BACL|nr:hypothetical protein [Paenibacillus agilis]TVX92158.1 hypothetical protein FPZ44_03260 [Paenibacillus agilis]